jgi:flagellar biosynthesis/type III secretory pathway protein FliH
MCTALDELYEQGVEQGMERGMEQGRDRGRKEEQELSIKNLMETMKWSAKQAMDALKIPEEERAVYLKRL